MLSGIARRLHAATNENVGFVSANGARRGDPLWQNIPYIAQHDEPAQALILSGRGHRPYYSHMEGNRIIWRKWDKAPGEIRLTDEERAFADHALFAEMGPTDLPIVLMGPRWKAKGGGGQNKDWGWDKWIEVANVLLRENIAWPVECCPAGEKKFDCAAYPVITPTFRHACAILERSIGYVGHEGGLHHAAAALEKPAVVVFGGYISPEVTGYDGHRNFYIPDSRYPLGCGTVTPCDHCRESMNKITVEQVVNAVKDMVEDDDEAIHDVYNLPER